MRFEDNSYNWLNNHQLHIYVKYYDQKNGFLGQLEMKINIGIGLKKHKSWELVGMVIKKWYQWLLSCNFLNSF